MERPGLRFSITPATTATRPPPTRAAARGARSLVGQSLPPSALPEQREPPAPQDQQVQQEQRERPDPPGQQVQPEQPARPDPPVLPVPLAPRAYRASKARPGLPGQLVRQGQLVQL